MPSPLFFKVLTDFFPFFLSVKKTTGKTTATMSEVFLSSEEERRILQTIAEFKASGHSEPGGGGAGAGAGAGATTASDRTIDKIYSQLEELKFETKDIEAALTATGGRCGIDPALEWLCVNVPPERLPESMLGKKYRPAQPAPAPGLSLEIVRPKTPSEKPKGSGDDEGDDDENAEVELDDDDWKLPDKFNDLMKPTPKLNIQRPSATATATPQKKQQQQTSQQQQKKGVENYKVSELKPAPEEPLIPKSWTGKTPAMILNEWCQRHKCQKPEYMTDKAPPGLHRVRVRVYNEKKVPIDAVCDTAYETAPSAKNAAAVRGLFLLGPSEQLYKMYPPYFKDMWLSWATAEKEKALALKQEKVTKHETFARSLKGSKAQQQQQQAQQSSQQTQQESPQQPKKSVAITRKRGEGGDKQRAQAQAELEAKSTRLYEELQRRRRQGEYLERLGKRERLPAWGAREALVKAVGGSQVTVVTGQTGCGKSTQVPQFILDAADEAGRGGECSIVCTQPRRISAVSLATRVAYERCEEVGTCVGYHVHLRAVRSAATRLLFCTTGILLRRLQGDAGLRGVTCVIVDEVHERDIDTDFLLAVLKRMIAAGSALKVVLMSATVDAQRFAEYFGGAPVVDMGAGKHHRVEEVFLEDIIEKAHYVLPPDSPYARSSSLTTTRQGSVRVRVGGELVDMPWEDFYEAYAGSEPLASAGIDARRYSRTTMGSLERLDPARINYELLEETIKLIDSSSSSSSSSNPSSSSGESAPGAVLVFLPGMAEIQAAVDQLHGIRGLRWPLALVPLHSTLGHADQQRAFERAPRGKRKVILATNIAETSITIDDIVYVIDTGRVKEFRYDRRRHLRCLTETWVSRASSGQRRGRAGRVADGVCYRLYTSAKFAAMDEFQTPEIKRIPLEELCLQILLLGFGPVDKFLAETLDPPTTPMIVSALTTLRDVGALVDAPGSASGGGSSQDNSLFSARLTALGRHLAALPVDVHVGKVLIYGCVFGCVGTALTLAAALSTISPFINSPLASIDDANRSRKNFVVPASRFSDHLALVQAFREWQSARRAGGASGERRFCAENMLSIMRLREISELRMQLKELLEPLGFEAAATADSGISDDTAVVEAVICAGLYPRVLRIERRPGAPRPVLLTATKEKVFVHPASVNRDNLKNLRADWLVYHEMVKSARVLVRDCTPITPRTLLLLGGNRVDIKFLEGKIVMDNWIEFKVHPHEAALFKKMRDLLAVALEEKFADPGTTKLSSIITTIVSLLKVRQI